MNTLRHSLRQLARSPAFTILAVLSLAVGIGINTTIFSAMDAAFLRPLPVREPREIVRFESPRFTFNEYEQIRESMKSLAGVIASSRMQMLFRGSERVEPVGATFVSDNYFSVLGVAPAAGRLFNERSPDLAEPIVVVSDALWDRHFGRDPELVGSTITLNDRAVTVVGVTRPGFSGETRLPPSELWVPLASQRTAAGDRRVLRLVGRLAPGYTAEQAQAEAETLVSQPGWNLPNERPNDRLTIWSEEQSRMDHGGRLTYLMGPIVGLVLLVACANVSCLLLGRYEERRREIAVRLALGASRAAVMGYLLTEALLLSLAGGALALLFTGWGLEVLPTVLPPMVAVWIPEMHLEMRVLLLTFGLSTLATLAFGLMPAWRASQLDVSAMLKSDNVHLGRTPGRSVLVVLQVMIAMVFLATAALFVRGFIAGANRDFGFTERNALFANIVPEGRPNSRELLPLFDDLRQTVASLPGVRAVSLATRVLGGRPYQVRAPGDDTAGNSAGQPVHCNLVDPGYFAALGIPLLQGRDFSVHDNPAGGRVAIVSEAVAHRLWPGENPVGQTLFAGRTDLVPREVVGVVRDTINLGERTTTEPLFYLPLRQEGFGDLVLIVTTLRSPGEMAAPVREALQRMDSSINAFNFDTIGGRLRLAMLPQWFVAWLGGLLGALAFVLAVSGLYGVIAYAVARRTRELGIRIAIGAAPRDAVWLVLRQGVKLALIGVALGMPVAIGAGVVARSGLFGVSPADPVALAASGILVVGVAALASYMPARRAARISPVDALRAE